MENKPHITHSDELVKEILYRLEEGETLTKICRDPHMPTVRTVTNWVKHNTHGFAPLYRESRQLFYERMADSIVDEAFDTSGDYKTIVNKKGQTITVPDQDVVNRSRLKVDTMKWLLAKRIPKDFGDPGKEETSNTQLAAGLLEIIKVVAQLGRQPVKAEVIDLNPEIIDKYLEDSKKKETTI